VNTNPRRTSGRDPCPDRDGHEPLPNHWQDQEAHASQLGERHLFFLVDDFGLECGPSYALTTEQAVPTDDPSVPEAIKTLSLASGWTLGRGPSLIRGQ